MKINLTCKDCKKNLQKCKCYEKTIIMEKRKNLRQSKENYKQLGRKSIYINPKNNILKTYRSNNHKLLDMVNKLIQNKNKINPNKLTEKQRKEAIDRINELLFI